MDLRIGTVDDLELVYKHAQAFAETTDRAKYFDPEKLKTVCLSFLQGPQEEKIIILAGDVGFIACAKQQFPFGYDYMGIEFALWVDPSARKSGAGKKLLQAFEYWAKIVGCSMVQASCPPNTIGHVYEAEGYKPFDHEYYKELI